MGVAALPCAHFEAGIFNASYGDNYLSPGQPKLVEEWLSEPIVMPPNQYWRVFRRYARDAVVGSSVGAAATGGLAYAMESGMVDGPMLFAAKYLGDNAPDLILSATSPVVDKAMLVPTHAWDYRSERRNLPEEEWHSRGWHAVEVLKSGAEDLAFQDVLYFGMMLLGRSYFPQVPPVVLSGMALGMGLAIVPAAEMGIAETLYLSTRLFFKAHRFKRDKYFEARFFFEDHDEAMDAVNYMAHKYGLCDPYAIEYRDLYFADRMPVFNGRSPYVKLRQRETRSGGMHRALQVVFRIAEEMDPKAIDQFRYFVTRKTRYKLYFDQEQTVEGIPDIRDNKTRRFLKVLSKKGEIVEDLRFRRTLAQAPGKLYVATDIVHTEEDRPFYVVEIKATDRPNDIKAAMAALMRRYPFAIMTTHAKHELLRMQNG